jgi:GNAT superfamily N-acetyltransferase
MKVRIERTNSNNKDFRYLILLLDLYLTQSDEAAHEVCKQYNNIETIKYVLVAYDGDTPVGCGAIRAFSSDTMEIKRMYVIEDKRGAGIATSIIQELEKWSKDLGCQRTILETGIRLPEAIKFYKKQGYKKITNYEPYINLANSVCYEKRLI